MAVDHLSVAILYYFISNNNLSKCVKVNPDGVKSVEISNGYPSGRYFDISAQQLDGKSAASLNVNKDTLKVVTYENNIWTDRYTLATKSDLENITPIFHDTVGTDKKELLRNKLSVLKGKKNGMYMIYGGWSTKMFGMTIGQVVGSSYMVMFITSTYIMISETNDFTTYGYRQVALTDF